MHRYATAMGNPSNHQLAELIAITSISQGHGTAWMDSHATERAATIVAARHYDARKNHVGESSVGW